MLQAMIDGQRDPKVPAEMARGSMRRKIPQSREALAGHFGEHHAFICATMLRRIDALAADIAGLDARIEEMIAPFAQAVEEPDEITGIGVRSAQEIIAALGVDMAAFPHRRAPGVLGEVRPDRCPVGRNKPRARLRCATPGAAARPLTHRFSSQPRARMPGSVTSRAQAGHHGVMTVTMYTTAERPDLWERGVPSEAVWPEYNLHGDVLNRWWGYLDEELPDYQFVLYDEAIDEVVAEGHTGPLWWDGSDATLPDGIDAAIEQIFTRARAEEPVNTLCALAAESPRDGRARGLAQQLLNAMRAIGQRHG